MHVSYTDVYSHVTKCISNMYPTSMLHMCDLQHVTYTKKKKKKKIASILYTEQSKIEVHIMDAQMQAGGSD